MFFLQQQFSVKMVKCGLSMALYLTREEWKSVLILSGVQSVMIGGHPDPIMLKLYADSLAII